MGKYKSAAKLAEKYGFDENLTRGEWKDLKKEHGGGAAALAYLGLKAEFDEQFDYIEDREAIWSTFANKVDTYIENTPEYEVPEAIYELVNTLDEYSTEIKDVYTSGAESIEDIVGTYLPQAMDTIISGATRQLATAEGAAEELGSLYEEGSEEMRSYYGPGVSKMYAAGEEAVDVTRRGAEEIGEIYKGAATGVLGAYGAGTQEMMGAARAGLGESLYGAGRYEEVYRQLAERTTLPGEEIYRQQIGAEAERGVERVKEYGAGQAGALTAVATQEAAKQGNLQQLAITRANWLTQNQQNYANAIQQASATRAGAYNRYGGTAATAAGMMGGAYTTAAGLMGGGGERLLAMQTGALQNLAGTYATGTQIGMTGAQAGTRLAGYGAETGANLLLEAQRYGTESTYAAQMADIATRTSAAETTTALEAMGVTEAAALATQAAETEATYADQAYYYNQLMPWQTGLSYYQGGTQQYDPYAGYMDYYGGTTGMAASNYQSAQESAFNWGDLLGSVIGAGAKVGAAYIGAG